LYDLEDLNLQVDRWLGETANSRVHGTTGEVPVERLAKERPKSALGYRPPAPDAILVSALT